MWATHGLKMHCSFDYVTNEDPSHNEILFINPVLMFIASKAEQRLATRRATCDEDRLIRNKSFLTLSDTKTLLAS